MEQYIYLSLGSNVGFRKKNLKLAIKYLNCYFFIVKKSKIYISKPWGYLNQEFFLNQVILVKSKASPFICLKWIFIVENLLGKYPSVKKKWGPRIIDIDILIYGNFIINHNFLQIPHPLMINRRFVLEPLLEISPKLLIPSDLISVSERLKYVKYQFVKPLERCNLYL